MELKKKQYLYENRLDKLYAKRYRTKLFKQSRILLSSSSSGRSSSSSSSSSIDDDSGISSSIESDNLISISKSIIGSNQNINSPTKADMDDDDNNNNDDNNNDEEDDDDGDIANKIQLIEMELKSLRQVIRTELMLYEKAFHPRWGQVVVHDDDDDDNNNNNNDDDNDDDNNDDDDDVNHDDDDDVNHDDDALCMNIV